MYFLYAFFRIGFFVSHKKLVVPTHLPAQSDTDSPVSACANHNNTMKNQPTTSEAIKNERNVQNMHRLMLLFELISKMVWIYKVSYTFHTMRPYVYNFWLSEMIYALGALASATVS